MTTNEAVKEEVEATPTESKPSKEVATKSNTAIATASLFEEDAGSGLENVTSEDITIPRLKILQAMSPEVNKKDGKYIEGAVAGDITNTVTKEIFREESIAMTGSVYREHLSMQPRVFNSKLFYKRELPKTNNFCSCHFAPPNYPELKDEEVLRIIETLNKV